jgi:hypothetical protein
VYVEVFNIPDWTGINNMLYEIVNGKDIKEFFSEVVWMTAFRSKDALYILVYSLESSLMHLGYAELWEIPLEVVEE